MAIQNVKGQGAVAGPAAAPVADAQKSQKTNKAAGAYANAAPNPTIKDAAQVNISQRAKEMNLARKVADKTPDVDEAAVQKFKQAISAGTYQPNAAGIANGMVNEALKDEFAQRVAHA